MIPFMVIRMAKDSSRKAQVIVTADQYALIHEYAREQGKTVSTLLRENLERTLLPELELRQRQDAFHRLTTQNLPTADWDVLERALEARWEGHGG